MNWHPGVNKRRKTKSLRKHLSKTYADLRADRENIELRLELAQSLVKLGRLDLARRHVFRVTNEPDLNRHQRRLAGELLFKLGHHAQAVKLLGPTIKGEKGDADALRTISAIRCKYEDFLGARQDLVLASKLDPFIHEVSNDNRPTVLLVRCAEGCFLNAVRDMETGITERLRKRGHFSTDEFISIDDFNVILYDMVKGFTPSPEDIPKVDMILNTASDGDSNGPLFPWMSEMLELFAGVPVLNHPRQVAKTTRDRNALRLGNIPHVLFPRTQNLGYNGHALSFLNKLKDEGFSFPLIIRIPGTQTGITVKKLENSNEALDYLVSKEGADEFYVTEYVDCKNTSGRYTKCRCFFIDGRFYPVAGLSSDCWQIHSGDRYRIMDKEPDTQEREKRYLSDPEDFLGPEVFQALHDVRDVIGLEFFGIDFTVTNDNRLLIFEANASMRHNFDHADNFPYTRPYLETISWAFNTMLRRRCGLT